METVVIAGVGLIGGSFGLALRAAGFTGELIGVSSARAIEAGLRSGAISSSASLEDAASQADLIYLSQPVDRILETIAQLGPVCGAETLITDAGSTKSAIVRQAQECMVMASFLGGHPMAGKERRGAEVAEANLFRDKKYVLTPSGPASPRETEFRGWLARMGCLVMEMTPAEHDAAVALTSHLPQLISTALAATVATSGNPRVLQVHGSGLLDMTRLALSSADLWSSILSTNKTEVLGAMDLHINILHGLRKAVESGDLVDIFAIAQTFASELRNTK